MLALTRMGAVVLPPMPAFYNKPSAVDDIVTHIVCRVLDQFGIENWWFAVRLRGDGFALWLRR
jgi:4-hydroxy-3-polyprenylbenzoate decarboxylase